MDLYNKLSDYQTYRQFILTLPKSMMFMGQLTRSNIPDYSEHKMKICHHKFLKLSNSFLLRKITMMEIHRNTWVRLFSQLW
jgi:hypothetical protein